MEVDETKFRQSRADGRLEKPFDKEALRKLVQHFVPKTKTQGLSEFLTLPDLRPAEASKDEYHDTLSHFQLREAALSDLKIDEDDESSVDEFKQGPSPFQPTVAEISPLTTQNEDENDEWVPTTLSSSRPATAPPRKPRKDEELYEVEIAQIQLPDEPPPGNTPDIETLPLMGRPRRAPPAPPPRYTGPPPQLQLDQKQLEELIRTELRPLIEETVARILPSIATQLIKDELDRLMKDTEQEL